MPTCIIFGAAPSWDYSRLPVAKEPGDLLICADGGYRHALALGLTPDWLVGDFDSLPEGGLADHIVQVRPEKDDTDANLAVLKGRELGYTNFVMYGGLGGRFDHSMANVQMMAGLAKEGIDLRLRDEQSELRVLMPGDYTIEKKGYHFLSLFALSEECRGITLCGMKYPLTDGTLTNLFPLGVSNEILQQTGTVSFTDGMLLLVQSGDRAPATT